MKKLISFILVAATVVFSASTCEKMEPGDYKDFSGAKINLLGAWVLSEAQYKTAEYSPNTLIVMYDIGVGKEPLVEAVKSSNAEIIYDYNLIPGMAIRIPNGSEINNWIAYFKSVKGVVSVERDRINHLVEPVKPRLEIM